MQINKKVMIYIAIVIVVLVVIALVSNTKKSNPSTSSQTVTSVSRTDGGTIVQPAYSVNMNSVNFSAPISPESSANITAADKKAVYEGLLAGFKTMTSGDAKAIRTYMTSKANSSAEKNFVTKMTDADIVSLSARLSQTMVMPVPEQLLSPVSIWTRDGNAMTIQYLDPNTGTTTKRAVNIGGSWY